MEMSASESPSTETAAPTPRYRRYVLTMLVIVYTMNFLDRQILAILATPVKADLGLTDGEYGMLGGLAFAILYSTLGIPIAWLADRSSRRRIIAWALGLWSAMTAMCGLASSFWQMFAARVGVGIGEAGGVAPSYSMIADYFPRQQRARALAIYSLGIPLGMSIGIIAGGLLAAAINWRTAFITVGVAGLVLAPIFRFTVRDPARGGMDQAAAAIVPAGPPPFLRVARTLLAKPTFWLLAFGAAASSVCGYGIGFWLPSFFQRSYELSLVETALFYGSLTLVGGGLGILGGGILADRLGTRSRSAYPRIPAVAFLISMPCFFLAVNSSNLVLAFALFLIPTGLNLMWLGPILTAIQHLVPGNMRTTASAMFLLINNLVGIAGGLWFFGAVSDVLRAHYGAESLRYAIYIGLGFYLVASTLFFLGSRTIKRDWVD